jgi:hypothetical protein
MKFAVPTDDNEHGAETSPFSSPFREVSGPGIPTSPCHLLQRPHRTTGLDASPDIRRIRQKLERRRQHWDEFCSATFPDDNMLESSAKLAYQQGLALISKEMEVQARERQLYMKSLEKLMIERSVAARTFLAEFRQQQKDLASLRIARVQEEQKRQLLEQQQKEEALKREQTRKDEIEKQKLLESQKQSISTPSEQNFSSDPLKIQTQKPSSPPGAIPHDPNVPSVVQMPATIANDAADIYTSKEVSERVLFYSTLIKVRLSATLSYPRLS